MAASNNKIIQPTMNFNLWNRVVRALLFGGKPNYLIAFVTGRCDMNCALCCDASRGVRVVPEMDTASWGAAVSGASALLQLTITGGEPFLRDDLIDVISAMVESSGVPRVSINTNGSRPERIEETLSFLLKQFPHTDFAVAVSLDGPFEIHDRLRGRPGAGASARETLNRLAPYREIFSRFTVRLQSLLQPANSGILETFLAETASWPRDFHEIIFPRDINPELARKLLPVYRRLTLRELGRSSSRYSGKLEWRLYRAVARQAARAVEMNRGFRCPAGGGLVEVLPDGTVLGCEIGRLKDRAAIGKVGNGKTLTDVVQGGPARRFRGEIAGSCCCTFECAIASRIVLHPTQWFRLFG